MNTQNGIKENMEDIADDASTFMHSAGEMAEGSHER